MGQGEVGLDHHGSEVGVLGIVFQHLGLGVGFRSPIHAVGAVDFLGDEIDAVAQFHLQRIEEFEVVALFTGVDNGIGEFQGAFAAFFPVLGLGATGTGGFGGLANDLALSVGVGVEPVDTDHRVDARLTNDTDHVDHVLNTLFHQSQIFLGVGVVKGFTRDNLGTAAVHLQGADRGGQDGDVGFEAGEAAFHVPELLEADVSGEAGLGDMVIPQLEADAVGDDGALTHGDVGEGTGVHQAGLVFGGAHQGRVDRVAHEGGHGVADFEITTGNRFAALVEGHGDFVDAVFQVGQVGGHGQDGHQLRTHGNAELALHRETIRTTTKADDDVAQGLGAEVDDPAHLHAGGIDVQAAHAGEAGQLFVIVVALMLHTGRHGDHAQVVRVHDVVDVAGETQGELGHGDQQRVAAAGCRAFYVHGGAAGRLTQGAADVFTTGSQTFHQSQ
ncbi:hypothetical protein DESC_100079 [Desulfosarcina cetonica]|nr:hypothetical protein DESC_100079 [Desulfosarcina cetonica]